MSPKSKIKANLGDALDSFTAQVFASITKATANLSEIEPGPWQPRRDFPAESLAELAQSIKERGLLDAPLVFKDQTKNKYLLVGGERRWRACQLLVEQGEMALNEIDIRILPPTLSTEQVWDIAIAHNKDREDINPFDESAHLHKLMETFGYTQERLAELYGVTQANINTKLQLMRLPMQIQREYLALPKEKRPSPSLFRFATSLKTEDEQLAWWSMVDEGTTFRDAKAIQAKVAKEKPKAKKPKAKPSPKKLLREAEQFTNTLEASIDLVAADPILYHEELLPLYERMKKAIDAAAKKVKG